MQLIMCSGLGRLKVTLASAFWTSWMHLSSAFGILPSRYGLWQFMQVQLAFLACLNFHIICKVATAAEVKIRQLVYSLWHGSNLVKNRRKKHFGEWWTHNDYRECICHHGDSQLLSHTPMTQNASVTMETAKLLSHTPMTREWIYHHDNSQLLSHTLMTEDRTVTMATASRHCSRSQSVQARGSSVQARVHSSRHGWIATAPPRQ